MIGAQEHKSASMRFSHSLQQHANVGAEGPLLLRPASNSTSERTSGHQDKRPSPAPQDPQVASKRGRRVHLKQSVPQTQWKTTLWRLGALAGLASILLALVSIFCGLGILVASDGQPVSRWKYQPSTYLAIFTAIADQSMRYASLQGVVVAWWLGALREGGVTIANLHHNWDMGTGLWSAILAGKRANLFAFACICSTFVAIDGPLLQQSSNVVPAPILQDASTVVSLTFHNISPQIPTNYTGTFTPNALPGWIAEDRNAWALPVNFNLGPYRDNVIDAPIEVHVDGCSGSCAAQIMAPALTVVDCKMLSGPVHFNGSSPLALQDQWPMDTYNPMDDYFLGRTLTPRNSKITFYTNLLWTAEDKEYLNITTISNSIEDRGSCSGTFNFTTCRLVSATAVYHVVITNLGDPSDATKASLTLPASVAYPRILALANNTTPLIDTGEARQPATLVGLAQGLANVVLRYYDTERAAIEDWTFMVNPVMSLKNGFTTDESPCSTYSDPFDDMLDSLNRLAFRIGMIAVDDYERMAPGRPFEDYIDAGLPTHQTVGGHRTGTWNVYRSNYWWFGGATLAQVICIAIVLPLYWGWWRLGRAVSFSPVELAKAFDAPLLAGFHSNLKAEDIAKQATARKARYGAEQDVQVSDQGVEHRRAKRLVFADAGQVVRPSINLLE